MSNILTASLLSVLERGNFQSDSVKISNDHKAVSNEESDNLKAIATLLGVDFATTGYTFRAVKGKNGVNFYGPYIANNDGTPTLFWGDAKVALTALAVKPTIEELDKKTWAQFDIGEDFVEVPMMLQKNEEGKRPALVDLRKALKAGKLADLLSKSFVKGETLANLQPGSYQVVSYTQDIFKGQVKFVIEVQGQGHFNANSAIARKLVDGPTITSDQPATLEVGEVVETTDTGYPIVPVIFTTTAAANIPVYDFG